MFELKATLTSARPWLMLVLVVWYGCPTTAGAAGAVSPDKSGYTLFNPTPEVQWRELSADRPDKTDSPHTVDAGHFQLEMDVANFSSVGASAENGHQRSFRYQIAPMNLKVGVLNDIDLQLALTPWQSGRVVSQSVDTSEKHSGFGDLTPRVKINLTGNDDGFFAVALIPSLTLPTAQDHVGDKALAGGLGIPYAFDVRGWDIGLQNSFFLNRDGTGHSYHSEIANSISIGHAVVKRLSYYVEFFSNVSTEHGSGWSGTLDTWLTYRVNANLRVDGGVYIGLTGAADSLHPWLGMTWRY
jgi:hypothetical protein